MYRVLSIALFGLVVAGCSSEPADESAPTPPPVIEDVMPEFAADQVLFMTGQTADTFVIPAHITASMNADGNLVLTGDDRFDNPAGQTSGVVFPLSPEQEANASGNVLKLKVLARAIGAESAPLNVAYSTNEVGTSGWNAFTVPDTWTEVSFDYEVFTLIEGKGDFVGLSPDGTELEVAGLGYDVVPAAE